MNNEKQQIIERLEGELDFLIKQGMTLEQKLDALNSSFWRAHNSGFCDYIAGLCMAGIDDGRVRQHDLDIKYSTEVSMLIDLLKEIKEEEK